MKRNLNIFLFTIFYLFGSPGFSQVNVTFKVDMQYQTVSEYGVYIAGSMQEPEWNPSSTPLSDDDENGIWEVTLSIAEYSSYEYKFINGNTWAGAENVWDACGAGNGNRVLNLEETYKIYLPRFMFYFTRLMNNHSKEMVSMLLKACRETVNKQIIIDYIDVVNNVNEIRDV